MRILLITIVLGLTSCSSKKMAESHDTTENKPIEYYMALGKRYQPSEEEQKQFDAAYSEMKEFALDIKKKYVRELIRYEEKAGSTKIEGRIVHIAGDMAYPLFYERQQDGILNLEVMYQFKRDSLMQYARYIWNDDQAEMEDARKKEFMLATAKKFNELEKMITKQYGPGKPQGDMSDFSKADTRAGMRKNSTWKLDSGQVITLEGVISNYYEEVGLVTFNPNYSIQLSIAVEE